MTKQEIRKDIYSKRCELSEKQYELFNEMLLANIKNFLINKKEFDNSKIVFMYSSYGKEADTERLFEFFKSEEIQVAYPLITNRFEREMSFFRVNHIDELEVGFKGIKEPVGDVNFDKFSQDAIFIVPLVAFTSDCKRVGYGGGFYDTYFSKHKSKLKIGIAFEFQMVDNIEIDEHDVELDYIITEKNMYGGKHEQF